MTDDRKRHDAPPRGTPACDPLGDIEERLEQHGRLFVDVRGVDGKNGKIGALSERVTKIETGQRKALLFVAGLIVAVVGAAVVLGGWMSSTRTDLAWLKQRTFHPADAPGKD